MLGVLGAQIDRKDRRWRKKIISLACISEVSEIFYTMHGNIVGLDKKQYNPAAAKNGFVEGERPLSL